MPQSDRPQWSTAALVRLAQYQDALLHIYVEGKEGDRFYYSKVLETTLDGLGITAQFHLSRELQGQGEGKLRCIDFHAELAGIGKLISTLEGKLTVTLVLVDKDVDDVEGALVLSPNLVYTQHYCVENHIAIESDVINTLAAAGGLDLGTVAAATGSQAQWLASCCEHWKEWTAFCLLAKTADSGVPNYRLYSPWDAPALAALKAAMVDDRLLVLSTDLGVSFAEIKERYEDSLLLVKSHLDAGTQDVVFKGKWYAKFLADKLRAIPGAANCNEPTLWTILISNVAPNHVGSEFLRIAVSDLLAGIVHT